MKAKTSGGKESHSFVKHNNQTLLCSTTQDDRDYTVSDANDQFDITSYDERRAGKKLIENLNKVCGKAVRARGGIRHARARSAHSVTQASPRMQHSLSVQH